MQIQQVQEEKYTITLTRRELCFISNSLSFSKTNYPENQKLDPGTEGFWCGCYNHIMNILVSRLK